MITMVRLPRILKRREPDHPEISCVQQQAKLVAAQAARLEELLMSLTPPQSREVPHV